MIHVIDRRRPQLHALVEIAQRGYEPLYDMVLVSFEPSDLDGAGDVLSTVSQEIDFEELDRKVIDDRGESTSVLKLGSPADMARLEEKRLMGLNVLGIGLRQPQGGVVFADPREVLVQLLPSLNMPIERARFAKTNDLLLTHYDYQLDLGTYRILKGDIGAVFERLAVDDRVLVAEPSFLTEGSDFESYHCDLENAIVSDRNSGDESSPLWNHDLISLGEVGEIRAGDGVVVAVVDARCDFQHAGMKDAYLDTSASLDFAPDHTAPGEFIHHGTQCASIIAGHAEVRERRPIGIAPGARILPIAIHTSRGDKYVSRVRALSYLCSILKQRHHKSTSGKQFPIERLIVNCSWSTMQPMPASLDIAFKALSDAGAIVVCSAGNSPTGLAHYPSDLEECISVAAVDARRIKTTYSNYGHKVDVCAPGGEMNTSPVLALGFGRPWTHCIGTSFAAPHVAAVLAIAWSAQPQAKASALCKQVFNEAVDNVYDVNVSFKNLLGSGLINAAKASQLKDAC